MYVWINKFRPVKKMLHNRRLWWLRHVEGLVVVVEEVKAEMYPHFVDKGGGGVLECGSYPKSPKSTQINHSKPKSTKSTQVIPSEPKWTQGTQYAQYPQYEQYAQLAQYLQYARYAKFAKYAQYVKYAQNGPNGPRFSNLIQNCPKG